MNGALYIHGGKSDGEIYRGVADTDDRFEVYSIIRREGGHLLH